MRISDWSSDVCSSDLLANSTLLVGFSGALTWEAVRRLGAPPQIPALPVIVVAAIGIVVNLGAAWFVRDENATDLNRRGAFLPLVAAASFPLSSVEHTSELQSLVRISYAVVCSTTTI